MKYKTELNLPVELIFDVLDHMQVGDAVIPAQLDITKVLLTIVGPSGKPRQVDITNTIGEEQIMLWEDNIVDSYFEDPDEVQP
jgi:hypothetical protein